MGVGRGELSFKLSHGPWLDQSPQLWERLTLSSFPPPPTSAPSLGPGLGVGSGKLGTRPNLLPSSSAPFSMPFLPNNSLRPEGQASPFLHGLLLLSSSP